MGHLVILTVISRHPHRIHVSLYFLGYSHVKHFSWDKYLEETNSLPAPARAFKVVREFALSPWFVCSMMQLIRGHLGNWPAGVAMRRSRSLKEMLSELFSFENLNCFWNFCICGRTCVPEAGRGVDEEEPWMLFLSDCPSWFLRQGVSLTWNLPSGFRLAGVSHWDLLASTSPAGILGAPPRPLCKRGFSEASVPTELIPSSSNILLYTLFFLMNLWEKIIMLNNFVRVGPWTLVCRPNIWEATDQGQCRLCTKILFQNKILFFRTWLCSADNFLL